jgi:hypothetical protein
MGSAYRVTPLKRSFPRINVGAPSTNLDKSYGSCEQQQGAAGVLAVPALGLMAYTFTLAAAAFTPYLLRRSESSACSVAESVFGAGEQHEPSAIAGEQQPDWFSTFA